MRDLAFLAGLGSFAGGLWLVYPPLALVLTGGLLLAVTLRRA